MKIATFTFFYKALFIKYNHKKGWLTIMEGITTPEITFDTLMVDITNTLDSIETNTTNVFIVKECGIIDIKLEEVRVRKYSKIETVESICNSIINNDISNIKGVLDQPAEMYERMNTLENLVRQITSVYSPL